MAAPSRRTTTSEGRDAMLQDGRDFLSRNALFRARDRQLLGRVCAGLGRRVELWPWSASLLFMLIPFGSAT